LALKPQAPGPVHIKRIHWWFYCIPTCVRGLTLPNSTALHLAAKKGHADVVQLLVHLGADVAAENMDGRLPLHLAARYGHRPVVEFLAEAAPPAMWALDKDGRSPLHLAALGGHAAAAEALRHAGADMAGRDRSGLTPADLAAQSGLGNLGDTPLVQPAEAPLQAAAVQSPTASGGAPLTGATAELLMQRLDPRLAHLVTQDALDALDEELAEDGDLGGGGDIEEEEEGNMFATLSGVSLQFDWELVRWERPVEMMLRQSLRGSLALPHMQAAAARRSPAGPPARSPGGTRRQRYRLASYEELRCATGGFAAASLLGQGGFGAVYRGCLADDTLVAIKVLDSSGLQGTEQFHCEVKVLSRVCHPHVVRLLASCPSQGCLVYELLPNGSLEDRLDCLGNTPPLTWQTRICIACEMASGLLFLHNCKPEAILHRDFKPANVLLDEHMCAKLGDVGLARLAPELVESLLQRVSTVKDSTPVGTYQYLDPEYARTGALSRKSDVYSLGISMLQLLTGRPPRGVVEDVEAALERGTLSSVVDPKAGDWPVDIAEVFARLALSAAEMRRRSRPDLEVEVLPVLRDLRSRVLEDHLEAVLRRCKEQAALRRPGQASPRPPPYFLCPISQELMFDPVLASDGYPYERRSLERWMEESCTSPMTNSRLEEGSLVEATVLKQAITKWCDIFDVHQ